MSKCQMPEDTKQELEKAVRLAYEHVLVSAGTPDKVESQAYTNMYIESDGSSNAKVIITFDSKSE